MICPRNFHKHHPIECGCVLSYEGCQLKGRPYPGSNLSRRNPSFFRDHSPFPLHNNSPVKKKRGFECLTISQPLCDTNHTPHFPGCALGNTSHPSAPSLSQFGFPPCCRALCPESRDCWKSWENVVDIKTKTFCTPSTAEVVPFWRTHLGLSRTSDY